MKSPVYTHLPFFLILLLTAPFVMAQENESPAEATISSVELPPELDRVLRDYEKGWQTRNAGLLASLFTPDGFILRPGHSPVQGRSAIEEAYSNSGGPLSLRALSYAREGKIGYIIGAFGATPGSPDYGKFILTLRQLSDGKWYISADMDNSNR